ncbi:unnamed protein product [Gadus morhua 'NCC']
MTWLRLLAAPASPIPQKNPVRTEAVPHSAPGPPRSASPLRASFGGSLWLAWSPSTRAYSWVCGRSAAFHGCLTAHRGAGRAGRQAGTAVPDEELCSGGRTE